jgi:hypothetical protein
VLGGLLDIRLDSRYGSGDNYSALQMHSWFLEQNILWDAVEHKKFPSTVASLYSKSVQTDIIQKFINVDVFETDACDDHGDVLTKEQLKALEGLYYLCPEWQAHYPNANNTNIAVDSELISSSVTPQHVANDENVAQGSMRISVAC